ncbi:MAG: hypothetical protein JNL92_07320, partial [Opitutaceae bacterium]|nr:hypothetical protein [Opitutaceae bacterium]
MQLTSESPRTRWLILLVTWCGCALAVALHTRAVEEYVAVLDGLGRRDATRAATPRQQVIPARYADAQMWVRHAHAGSESGEARVRF